MKPELRAAGCVAVFWAFCLIGWWLTTNAPAVLGAVLVGFIIVVISFLIYSVARVVQEIRK